MQLTEIMTKEPACCTPTTKLSDVAKMMKERDCGEIPVVESESSRRPVGVLTDRDITIRAFADGRDPKQMTAGDCMTTPVHTVPHDATLETCAREMAQHQIRRVPVIDSDGKCCGMVSQADLARRAPNMAGAVLKHVSKPN